jgi:hypothetical protein
VSQISDLTARLLRTERHRDELFRANLRYRDFLLKLAKDCESCDGTGCATVHDETGTRVEPCPECEDIREVLQSC